MSTDVAINPNIEHLSDLRGELADWLRAHTGWLEQALLGACSLAVEATSREPDQTPLEATAIVEGSTVHLHVARCAEIHRVTDTHPGRVVIAAHDGDIVLQSQF